MLETLRPVYRVPHRVRIENPWDAMHAETPRPAPMTHKKSLKEISMGEGSECRGCVPARVKSEILQVMTRRRTAIKTNGRARQ